MQLAVPRRMWMYCYIHIRSCQDAAVSTASPPNASPPIALQHRSRRTRRVVLDAAFRVLEQQGPEALTITAVSAEAGVASGTVYRRFGDKDGLMTELQAEFTTEFGQRMSAAEPGEAPPPIVIDRAVRALADTFHAHETLLRVFVILGMREPQMLAAGSQASHEGGRQFRDLLWRHREAFSTNDPEHAIDVVHRIVYATCMHRVLHGPHMESPTPLSWAELTDELSRTATLSLLGVLPISEPRSGTATTEETS